MLSFYIHIPFCENKCKYCSFCVIPTWNINEKDTNLKKKYIDALFNEIDFRANRQKWNKIDINTLYFWWWTPLEIWAENIIRIIEYLWEKFNLECLSELSIELNPYPTEKVLNFVKIIWKKYSKFSRLRFSFWIQTFDSNILKESWRMYSFPTIVEFLRELRKIKQMNFVYNFDYISFWYFNKTKKWNKILWDNVRMDFFYKFVNSYVADSFSLYLLELQTWSEWTKDNCNICWSDDYIYDEFLQLKSIITNANYHRYEISNYSLISKESIHNMVYRNMENYIWIWQSASSFLNLNTSISEYLDIKNLFNIEKKLKWIRWTNNKIFKKYVDWNFIWKDVQYLYANDFLIEEFFLKLRTSKWIDNIKKYLDILEDDVFNIFKKLQDDWFILFEWNLLKFSDKWMDLYNNIITEIMKKI